GFVDAQLLGDNLFDPLFYIFHASSPLLGPLNSKPVNSTRSATKRPPCPAPQSREAPALFKPCTCRRSRAASSQSRNWRRDWPGMRPLARRPPASRGGQAES